MQTHNCENINTNTSKNKSKTKTETYRYTCLSKKYIVLPFYTLLWWWCTVVQYCVKPAASTCRGGTPLCSRTNLTCTVTCIAWQGASHRLVLVTGIPSFFMNKYRWVKKINITMAASCDMKSWNVSAGGDWLVALQCTQLLQVLFGSGKSYLNALSVILSVK